MASQSGLNPQAPPFFPLQYVVVSNPDYVYHYHPSIPPPPLHLSSLPLPPPPPPSFFPYHEVRPSYAHEVAEEGQNLQNNEQEEELEKVKVEVSNSKQRFLMRAIINGCGRRRRTDARREKEFRPLPRSRWADGNGGDGHRKVQVRGLESSRAFPRRKNQQHLLLPLRSDGVETTIMIKNIPNKYNREMLVEYLENHCLAENKKETKENEQSGEPSNVSAFDLVYLPIDFKSKLNKGYAFVNFTNPEGALRFHKANNNQKWDLFQSHKICDVVAARLQGKEKLERHLDSMCFPCGREEVLPVCFSPPRDGTIKGSRRTLGKLVDLNIDDNGGSATPSGRRHWKE